MDIARRVLLQILTSLGIATGIGDVALDAIQEEATTLALPPAPLDEGLGLETLESGWIEGTWHYKGAEIHLKVPLSVLAELLSLPEAQGAEIQDNLRILQILKAYNHFHVAVFLENRPPAPLSDRAGVGRV